MRRNKKLLKNCVKMSKRFKSNGSSTIKLKMRTSNENENGNENSPSSSSSQSSQMQFIWRVGLQVTLHPGGLFDLPSTGD